MYHSPIVTAVGIQVQAYVEDLKDVWLGHNYSFTIHPKTPPPPRPTPKMEEHR